MGAFRRLVELGLYKNVSCISSVSGGSITSSVILQALNDGDFKDIKDFDKRVVARLKKLGQSRFREKIVIPVFVLFGVLFLVIVLLFYNLHISLIYSVLTLFIILLFVQPRKLFSKMLLFLLDKSFYKGKLLKSNLLYPEICFNATCLNTGKRFRFKQNNIGGNKIGETKDIKDIKLSFAVACSAAFPQLFAPFKLMINKRRFVLDWWTKNVKASNHVPKCIYLSDGGVYDNLGTEGILKGKEPFVILDAGGYIPEWHTDTNPNWFIRNTRIISTALDQIISLRRRILYSKAKDLNGVQLILGAPVKEYLDNKKYKNYGRFGNKTIIKLSNYDIFDEKIDCLLADLRTDLDGFHNIEIDLLMWAGSVRMDIAIKKYFRKYLTKEQLSSSPIKPSYNEKDIIRILKLGRSISIIGFLHKSLTKI